MARNRLDLLQILQIVYKSGMGLVKVLGFLESLVKSF